MGKSNSWKIFRMLTSKPRRTWFYGKLWGGYLCTAGIGPFNGENYTWPTAANDYFTEISDVTQDVDTLQDYHQLMENLNGKSEKK